MHMHKLMNSILSNTGKVVAKYGTVACSEAYKNSKTKTIDASDLFTADGDVDYDKVYDLMFMLDNGLILNLPSKSMILDKETNILNVQDSTDGQIQEYDFSGDAIAEIISEYRPEIIEESRQKNEEYVANVIFKKFAEEDGGEIIALFPDEAEDTKGNILSYMHNGQHAPASPELLNDLEDATPEEYAELKKELEDNYDYRLRVLNGSNLSEDYTIDSALAHLDDEIKSAKAVLDRVQERVRYRMKDNVSYSGDEAIDKVHQIADKISQDSLALHDLVYNDIIG